MVGKGMEAPCSKPFPCLQSFATTFTFTGPFPCLHSFATISMADLLDSLTPCGHWMRLRSGWKPLPPWSRTRRSSISSPLSCLRWHCFRYRGPVQRADAFHGEGNDDEGEGMEHACDEEGGTVTLAFDEPADEQTEEHSAEGTG
jgi:hypothetical protein